MHILLGVPDYISLIKLAPQFYAHSGGSPCELTGTYSLALYVSKAFRGKGWWVIGLNNVSDRSYSWYKIMNILQSLNGYRAEKRDIKWGQWIILVHWFSNFLKWDPILYFPSRLPKVDATFLFPNTKYKGLDPQEYFCWCEDFHSLYVTVPSAAAQNVLPWYAVHGRVVRVQLGCSRVGEARNSLYDI